MALWQFTHLNKHGNFRQRIIHTKGALSLPGGGLGPHVMASRFKYKYEEPVMAPSLFKTNGKTYLMPIWKEVVEGTTLDDIEVEKKLFEELFVEPKTWTYKSSSSDKTYTVKYNKNGNLSCDCWGYIAHRKCKHIKDAIGKING